VGAALIGREIFGAAFESGSDLFAGSWVVFLSVTAVMLLVASIATAIAASRIRAVQPAVILRGE
jgi:ABC-type lipoprotein release transport system permease subunit